MAQSASKYAEIQQDEIEVLRSIYMEDFVEVKTKTGAWNVGKLSRATCGVRSINKNSFIRWQICELR